MAKSRTFGNPFYVLLVFVGAIFLVTCMAYFVMTLHGAQDAASADGGTSALLVWMEKHGTMALLIQLAALGVLTFAAIGTDEFWQRRNRSTQVDSSETEAENEATV